MKLRIMGVVNTSKLKGNRSMVDSVTDEEESLVIPRLLEISSVQVSKYGMVTEVYLSHICFKGHHNITTGVSRDLKDRME